MKSANFAADDGNATPLYLVEPDGLEALLDSLGAPARAWAEASQFKAGAGSALVVPGTDGKIKLAIAGLGKSSARARKRFAVAGAAAQLPGGPYRIEAGGLDGADLEEAALGWLLGQYAFDRYATTQPPVRAGLCAPEGLAPDAARRLEAIATGEFLTRDLINTPAADMGPADLERAARDLAERHGASVSTILGDDLLGQNFPMIHAVGRAAAEDRAPRLIEMTWGAAGPTVTLVGKGVCFDTGGLNLKPGASMGLMKKDMGGAATVLGLAHMIMATDLPVQLRVLIPAVENAVSGPAFRPGDILTSRKGLTVEINNTDAEGRLVLADALALADETPADLTISMATLTGAARVAVGPDLAPYYTDDDAMAAALTTAAAEVRDPVWRMPFHAPYEAMIEPGIADLDNAPKGGFAGSITAALFLRRFVETGPYLHFDIYGWQPALAPGRPKGGVGQGARAVLAALPSALGL